MHHIFRRHGFRSSSPRRRRTVSRERSACSVNRTISPASSSSVQRLCPAGGVEHAVATSSAVSLPDSLRDAPWAGLLAQRQLEVAFHKAPLGAIDRRDANRDTAGDPLVADTG